MRLWRASVQRDTRVGKQKDVKFDGEVHWFSLPHAASFAGMTKPELTRRALAGELTYQEDRYGRPIWFAAQEIFALQKVAKEAERAKIEKQGSQKPRQKMPRQLEAEWAKISRERDEQRRDGPFLDAHLRLTLPSEEPQTKK